MILQSTDWQTRLNTARRVFSMIPLMVFLLALMLFAGTAGQSAHHFVQLLLRALVASLVTSLVCMAAFNFYRYLLDKSPGL